MKFRIKNGDTKFNYEEINSLIFSYKISFEESGIEKGSHVGILSDNNLEYVISILALISLDAVIIPINTKFAKSQIENNLKRFDVEFLITNKEVNFKNLINFPDLEINSQTEKDYIRNLREPNKSKLETISNIILSSGSTGDPKGVVHNFANHLYHAESSNRFLQFFEEHSWLLTLPLYHVGGFSIIWKCLLADAQLEIPLNSSDISNTNSTHFSFVLTQFKRILENSDQLKAVTKSDCILLGGSAIPASLIKSAIELDLPIRTSYGMSEMSSQIATSPFLSLNEEISYLPLKYSEIKLLDNKVFVKGKTLFQGYYNSGKIEIELDQQGYFQTGDLGEVINNQLVILGRIDNMFISGGENIYPEKIENEISKLTGSQHCYVLPLDDPEYGQATICVLDKDFDEEQLKQYLNSTLSEFELPKKYYQFPEDEHMFKANRNELVQLVKKNKLKRIH